MYRCRGNSKDLEYFDFDSSNPYVNAGRLKRVKRLKVVKDFLLIFFCIVKFTGVVQIVPEFYLDVIPDGRKDQIDEENFLCRYCFSENRHDLRNVCTRSPLDVDGRCIDENEATSLSGVSLNDYLEKEEHQHFHGVSFEDNSNSAIAVPFIDVAETQPNFEIPTGNFFPSISASSIETKPPALPDRTSDTIYLREKCFKAAETRRQSSGNLSNNNVTSLLDEDDGKQEMSYGQEYVVGENI